MWHRIRSLIIKEMLAIWRDPKGRAVIVVPPLLQLVIFAFAMTMEVRNVDIAVLNLDTGSQGREVEAGIRGASAFDEVIQLQSVSQIQEAIDSQRVIAVVHIAPDFTRRIEAGQSADVQIILDGRKSNASQIVNSYLAAIISRVSAAAYSGGTTPDTIRIRHWYNPNLEYAWFTLPGLVATITLLTTIIVTALSVARERELGTFDQLLVSPLRPLEIVVGKSAPGLIFGYLHGTFFILVAIFGFKIPFAGSLLALYGSMFFYLLAVIGIGLFISAISATQQQAILGAFVFASPAVLLSGFMSPIENMPGWMQVATQINPLRHFLVVAQGVFLKDLPLADVARNTLPLVLIAMATLPAAAWLLRKKTS
ncbi:ABC transporter permease [Hyphomonas sp.]|uniref:ABC transporter permease n=1 Tax=Hyphomonas sp. TaxID=87 RepID=UPI0030F7FA75